MDLKRNLNENIPCVSIYTLTVDSCGGVGIKRQFSIFLLMDWDFSEDAAFIALCDAFKESGETSAIEFLANGEGAFHFQELTQNAAGEGLDLSDTEFMEEFQIDVIESMEELCN